MDGRCLTPEIHGAEESSPARSQDGPEQPGAKSLGRLQELDVRLAQLEADQQASQKDFAVQREYHTLGLAQSKISFTLGYVFGALSAVVILAAISMARRA